eukprot:COSAG01_NODE_72201_length_253_cov_1.350649_1_plen_31_part_01
MPHVRMLVGEHTLAPFTITFLRAIVRCRATL